MGKVPQLESFERLNSYRKRVAIGQNRDTGRGRDDPVSRRPAGQLVFSPDGKTILAGGVDKTIRVIEAASGKISRTIPKQPGLVSSLDISPDGKHAVVIYRSAEHFNDVITSDCWIWGTEAYWPIFKGRESRSMGERSWATITSLPSPRPPLQPAHQNPQSSPQPPDTLKMGRDWPLMPTIQD